MGSADSGVYPGKYGRSGYWNLYRKHKAGRRSQDRASGGRLAVYEFSVRTDVRQYEGCGGALFSASEQNQSGGADRGRFLQCYHI